MVNRVQTLRSSSQGVRPTGRSPGELYVNFPDRQIGVVDASAAAVDLVAVRYFSTGASYAVGDYVIQAGVLYRATAVSAPGAFAPANWSKVQSAADLATGYLPLAGGTLTGALLLSGDPSVALNPVTLQYLQAQLALYYPKTGGVLTGNAQINPAAGPASLAINPAAAAQQAMVNFLQAGAARWQLGKQTDDSFLLYDSVAAANVITVASNGTTVNFSRGIILPADPGVALGAATKQYVDARVAKAGDTMTGTLTVPSKAGATTIAAAGSGASAVLVQNGAPASPDAAFMSFLRQSAWGAYFGVDSDNQFKVGGWSFGANAYRVLHEGLANPIVLANPTLALGIAPKQYVDAVKTGVTDGSNAAAGQVGEFLSSNGSSGLTNNTAINVAVLSLPAGDWDVSGVCGVVPSAAASYVVTGINLVSNTLPAAGSLAQITMTSGILTTQYLTVPTLRVSIAVTTNVYLVAQVGFGSGTCAGTGWLTARRRR